MSPNVISVKTFDNYTLLIIFENKETKLFDVKPYLKFTVFKPLENLVFFKNPKIKYGNIVWGLDDEIDFCPDTLYLESKPIN